MPGSARPLSKFQLGKEDPRGTAVAATNLIIGNFKPTEINEIGNPGYDRGLLPRHPDGGVLVAKGFEFEVDGALSFEQVLYPFAMGVKGGVTATQPDNANDPLVYLHTHTPPVAADPLPDAYTIEWQYSDGAASPTLFAYEAEYCLVKEMAISGQHNELVQLRYSGFGRQVTDSDITADVAQPAMEYAVTNLAKFYIDTSWSGLGGTQQDATLLGFEFTYRSGLVPQVFADGNLYFTEYGFGSYGEEEGRASLRLTMKYHTIAEARLAALRARTVEFIRLDMIGSAMAGTTPFNKMVRIDGAYVPVEWGSVADRDGSIIVDVTYMSVYDATGAQDVELSSQNLLAAIP